MTIDRRQASGTVLALRGSFDAAEADRLHEVLLELEPDSPVTLDFREVRLFHDMAVARLARDLVGEHGRRLKVLGLCEHHHRLMRYFSVSAEAAQATAATNRVISSVAPPAVS